LCSVSSLASEKKIFEISANQEHIIGPVSETTGPIGTKLSRNVPWMVLYKVSVFHSSRIFNIIYSLGSVSSFVSEKKIFGISANQSILLALAAMLNIRLE
jgi:hypothetical protein